MSDPLSAWLDWFEGLTPEVARELGRALIHLFPGDLLTPGLLTADPTDGLGPRIRRLGSAPHKAVGLALTLAAMTDLAFTERAEPEHADRTDAMLDVLGALQGELDPADPTGEMLEGWVAEQKLRHPLRARQWAKEAEGWRRLRGGPLSPDALLRALRGGPVGD